MTIYDLLIRDHNKAKQLYKDMLDCSASEEKERKNYLKA